MAQELSEFQKNILGQIHADISIMETNNNLQYALKGLLSEISHLFTKEYFDPAYIAQKARIIRTALEDNSFYEAADQFGDNPASI